MRVTRSSAPRVPLARPFSLAALAALAALLASACAATQAAAARDPMRCERDPNCTEHADKSRDCITQCVDDPACTDRCREVTGQPK